MNTKSRRVVLWAHAEAVFKGQRDDDGAAVVKHLNAALQLLEGMTKSALAAECTDGSTATFRRYFQQSVADQFGKKVAAGLHFS